MLRGFPDFPLILLMVQKSSCLDLLKVSDFLLFTMVNYNKYAMKLPFGRICLDLFQPTYVSKSQLRLFEQKHKIYMDYASQALHDF